MLFIILIIVIAIALTYAFRSRQGLNRNERLYLKRRGYEPPTEIDERPRVSKDTPLFSAIESLSDVSAFARQRAAEDLARMCESGRRDPRMLSALIAALEDNDASVRGAVATALGKFGDAESIEALKKRMTLEESVHVRASLERALEKAPDR
ncbi:MAG TPA: HEAT repeat domain-containing protein [Blastocatellia bacterium]|nr:HEAT repeat domain-containing protein [Blastocatellia bacterium]